jgi:hypothetical protein
VPGARDQPETILFARQAIEAATWYLTVPGLALLLLTGVFMTVYGKLGFLKRRWLTVHQLIALLIILNAALVLVPVGGELLRGEAAIIEGSGSLESFKAIQVREITFGAINLILALITVFIAVSKPALGKTPR